MVSEAFIRSLAMFEGCSLEVVAQVAAAAGEEAYPGGGVLFAEGSQGDRLYVVVDGQVEIIKNYGRPDQKLLSVLTAGEVFGEMSLFSVVRRTATAVARPGAVVAWVPSAVFTELFAARPGDGLPMVRWMLFNMGARLEQTSRELASVYSIARIIIASVSDPGGMPAFLGQVCQEISSALGGARPVGLYVYNVFNDEFELGGSAGEAPFMPAFERTDPAVAPVFERSAFIDELRVGGACFAACPMVYADRVTGFVLVACDGGGLPQRMKDLVYSITILVGVAVENLRHLQEERQLQRLRQEKSRYTF